MLHIRPAWGDALVNRPPERREGERRSVMLDCRIDGLSHRKLTRLTDLSLTGGYVDTDACYRPGDRIELSVVLDGTAVTIVGVVMHAQVGTGFGFRIDPDRSTEAALRRIAEFLGDV